MPAPWCGASSSSPCSTCSSTGRTCTAWAWPASPVRSAVAADLMERAVGGRGRRGGSLLIAVCGPRRRPTPRSSRAPAPPMRSAATSGLLPASGAGTRGRARPVNALWLQGAVALAWCSSARSTRNGFETMVEYTAPVFWLFFLLTGVSLLVLRRQEPDVPRPFRVPLYPVTPLLFCATCAYLLYASLAYAGVGALVGWACWPWAPSCWPCRMLARSKEDAEMVPSREARCRPCALVALGRPPPSVPPSRRRPASRPTSLRARPTSRIVDRMLKMADVKTGRRALRSGLRRRAHRHHRRQALRHRGVGIDIDPQRIAEAHENARRRRRRRPGRRSSRATSSTRTSRTPPW